MIQINDENKRGKGTCTGAFNDTLLIVCTVQRRFELKFDVTIRFSFVFSACIER